MVEKKEQFLFLPAQQHCTIAGMATRGTLYSDIASGCRIVGANSRRRSSTTSMKAASADAGDAGASTTSISFLCCTGDEIRIMCEVDRGIEVMRGAHFVDCCLHCSSTCVYEVLCPVGGEDEDATFIDSPDLAKGINPQIFHDSYSVGVVPVPDRHTQHVPHGQFGDTVQSHEHF